MSLVTPYIQREMSSITKPLQTKLTMIFKMVNGLEIQNVYNTNSKNSGYDYIFDSNKIKKQTIEVTASSLGVLSGVGIVTGGTNYQVGDELVFDNSQSSGKVKAQGKVSSIEGKRVDTVSVQPQLR